MPHTDPAPIASPPRGLAFVGVPVAPVHAEPRVSSPQTSQALYGRPVWRAARQGDWHHVHTAPDGYQGWVHGGYLLVVDDPDLEAVLADEEASDDQPAGGPMLGFPEPLLVSLGCAAREGGRALRLPLGAWLAPDATLTEGEAVLMSDLPGRFPRDGAAVVATAAQYFGSTSYQWGGLTPWGADCSGLVQSVHALHGVELPRDAWQQALVGADAGLDLGAHRPGDLLFFSDQPDGRVTHVGLATGDGAMCHLALGRGGWAVDALVDPADAYAERLAGQLVAARRVLV
jgi:hypothetical protein